MPFIGACEICNKVAYMKCGACHTVTYCGKEHQRKHWSKHRDVCRAYEVKSSPKLGRHLVAKRNIPKGDEIISEDALAIGPALMGAIPWPCPGCHRAVFPEYADKCPDCKWPVCSKNCSGLTDPNFHGSECELLKIVKQVTNAYRMDLLLPLRCLILQTTKPKSWKLLETIAVEASVQNVNSETDRVTADLQNDLELISQAALHIIPDCSATTIQNVFCLLKVCGRGLFTPYSGPLAAVYNVSSLLVHSCVPNVTISYKVPANTMHSAQIKWRGRTTVKPTRDIRKGEILTFPFANTFYCTLDRLNEIVTLRNFRCVCARCLDPSELGTHSGTLKCLDCPGYILPRNPENIENCDWVCDKGCGKKLTTAKVQALHHGLFLQIGKVRSEPDLTINRLESLLRLVEKFVHPHHYLCITVKHLLAKTYGEGEGGLRALTTKQLMRKSALSKEVWTTMSDPNILLHGATIVAESLMEHFRADFEILKRKFHSNEWNVDRVLREVIECRSLLSGIFEVCKSEPFYPPRAKLVKDATEQDVVTVTWATVERLPLPKK